MPKTRFGRNIFGFVDSSVSKTRFGCQKHALGATFLDSLIHQCRKRVLGAKNTFWVQHSSPLGVKSDVFIDIGLQTSSYCRGDIHIWKTDRAAARDLEGVGAPSSILLEQIGGVGGDLKRLDKTRHFRNMRPRFLDTVVQNGRKWRFGTRVSQKLTQARGRKAGATGLGK